MAESSFDLAIFGATPMACLVAGLLASQHSKRVCLIGERWSPHRLPRRFDLALLLATRPETWAMLKAGGAETGKVLNGLGKGLYTLIDPLLIAETPASVDALAHLRMSAASIATERVADRGLADPGIVWRLRDIPVLVQGRFEPVIDAWLDRVEVRRLAPGGCTVTLRRDGTARIRTGEREFDAARSILADDAAILGHLDDESRGRLVRSVPTETVLTEPAKPLAAPHVVYLDRGVTVSQRGKSGITAIATGTAQVETRIGACLAPQGRLRRAGAASHTGLDTVDGAPLVGAVRGSKTIMIAGFGAAGAFFAPALARWLAQKPSPAEEQYFESRGLGRGSSRAAVADYAPEPQP